MARRLLAVVAVLLTLAFTGSSVLAQTTIFDFGADPDQFWNTATNWDSDVVPTTGDGVYIGGGFTADLQTDQSANDLLSLNIGHAAGSFNGAGTLNISTGAVLDVLGGDGVGGTLGIFAVGNGSQGGDVVQTGGTATTEILSFGSGNSADSYRMTGGTLNVSQDIGSDGARNGLISVDGGATFDFTGTNIDVNEFWVGADDETNLTTFTLTTGQTLETGGARLLIGEGGGQGRFVQQAGTTVNVGVGSTQNVVVGGNTDKGVAAEYIMEGGTLTMTNQLNIGNAGAGYFEQQAGDVIVDRDVQIGKSPVGDIGYLMQGGTLTVGNDGGTVDRDLRVSKNNDERAIFRLWTTTGATIDVERDLEIAEGARSDGRFNADDLSSGAVIDINVGRNLRFGFGADSDSEVFLDGVNVTMNVAGIVDAGNNNNSALLRLDDGATLNVTGNDISVDTFTIGDDGTNPTSYTQAGGTVTARRQLNLGKTTATGTYNLNAGTLSVQRKAAADANSGGGTGDLNVANGATVLINYIPGAGLDTPAVVDLSNVNLAAGSLLDFSAIPSEFRGVGTAAETTFTGADNLSNGDITEWDDNGNWDNGVPDGFTVAGGGAVTFNAVSTTGTLTDGGVASANADWSITVTPGAAGTITATYNGTAIDNDPINAVIPLGYGGTVNKTGDLQVAANAAATTDAREVRQKGGTVKIGNNLLLSDANNGGIYNVSGGLTGGTLSVTGDILEGGDGSKNGQLYVNSNPGAGGAVTFNSQITISTVEIGNDATVLNSDGFLVIKEGQSMTVDNEVRIGAVDGATGRLDIQPTDTGGTPATLTTTSGISLGYVANSTGVLNIGDPTVVGSNATAGGPVINVSGANTETAENGTGTINMYSGTYNQTTNNIIIGQQNGSDATFNLYGGTVNVSGSVRPANNTNSEISGRLNVYGGTLALTGNLDTFNQSGGTLTSGGAWITVDDTNATSVDEALVTTGGSLILSGQGNDTVTTFDMVSGTVNIGDAADDDMRLATGGTTSAATANITGGSLNIFGDVEDGAGTGTINYNVAAGAPAPAAYVGGDDERFRVGGTIVVDNFAVGTTANSVYTLNGTTVGGGLVTVNSLLTLGGAGTSGTFNVAGSSLRVEDGADIAAGGGGSTLNVQGPSADLNLVGNGTNPIPTTSRVVGTLNVGDGTDFGTLTYDIVPVDIATNPNLITQLETTDVNFAGGAGPVADVIDLQFDEVGLSNTTNWDQGAADGIWDNGTPGDGDWDFVAPNGTVIPGAGATTITLINSVNAINYAVNPVLDPSDSDWSLSLNANTVQVTLTGPDASTMPLTGVFATDDVAVRQVDARVAAEVGADAGGLQVSNNAQLTFEQNLYLGGGAQGTVDQSDANSVVTVDGNLIFGGLGATEGGTYNLNNGTLHVRGYIDEDADGDPNTPDAGVNNAQMAIDSGTLLVDGPLVRVQRFGLAEDGGTTTASFDSHQLLHTTGTTSVGDAGTATLNLSGSVWQADGHSWVGDGANANGTLNMTAGAWGASLDTSIFEVGGGANDTSAGVGTINLDGESTLAISAILAVGIDNNSTGLVAGSGSVTIDGGSRLAVAGNKEIRLGQAGPADPLRGNTGVINVLQGVLLHDDSVAAGNATTKIGGDTANNNNRQYAQGILTIGKTLGLTGTNPLGAYNTGTEIFDLTQIDAEAAFLQDKGNVEVGHAGGWVDAGQSINRPSQMIVNSGLFWLAGANNIVIGQGADGRGDTNPFGQVIVNGGEVRVGLGDGSQNMDINMNRGELLLEINGGLVSVDRNVNLDTLASNQGALLQLNGGTLLADTIGFRVGESVVHLVGGDLQLRNNNAINNHTNSSNDEIWFDGLDPTLSDTQRIEADWMYLGVNNEAQLTLDAETFGKELSGPGTPQDPTGATDSLLDDFQLGVNVGSHGILNIVDAGLDFRLLTKKITKGAGTATINYEVRDGNADDLPDSAPVIVDLNANLTDGLAGEIGTAGTPIDTLNVGVNNADVLLTLDNFDGTTDTLTIHTNEMNLAVNPGSSARVLLGNYDAEDLLTINTYGSSIHTGSGRSSLELNDASALSVTSGNIEVTRFALSTDSGGGVIYTQSQADSLVDVHVLELGSPDNDGGPLLTDTYDVTGANATLRVRGQILADGTGQGTDSISIGDGTNPATLHIGGTNVEEANRELPYLTMNDGSQLLVTPTGNGVTPLRADSVILGTTVTLTGDDTSVFSADSDISDENAVRWNGGAGSWTDGSQAEWDGSNPGGFALVTNDQFNVVVSPNPLASAFTDDGGDNFSVVDDGTASGTVTLQYDGGGVQSSSFTAIIDDGSAVGRTGQLEIGPGAGIARGGTVNAAKLIMVDGTLTMDDNLLLTNQNNTEPAAEVVNVDQRGGTIDVAGHLVFGGAAAAPGGVYAFYGGVLNVGGDIVEGLTDGTVDDTVDGAQFFVEGDGSGITVTGGDISVQSFRVGYYEGSVGSFDLAGGETLATSGTFAIGDSGTGTMTSAGDIAVNTDMSIGRSADGVGTFTMTGGTITDVSSGLDIGNAAGASGTFNLVDGTVTVSGGEVQLANNATAVGVLNIGDGTSSPILNVSGNFEVAENGTGTVNMKSGTVNMQSNGNLVLSQQGGTHGTFNLEGGTLDLRVGSADSHGDINSNNGLGMLNQTGGNILARDLNLSNSDNSSRSVINFSGGDADFEGNLDFRANAGAATVGNDVVNVSGTALVKFGTVSGNVLFRNSTDRLNLSGGTLDLGGGQMLLTEGGTIPLNSPVINDSALLANMAASETGTADGSGYVGQFQWTGGTLKNTSVIRIDSNESVTFNHSSNQAATSSPLNTPDVTGNYTGFVGTVTSMGIDNVVAGKLGNALYFDGNNDSVQFGAVDEMRAPSVFSVAMWYYQEADTPANASSHNINNTLVSQGGSSGNDNFELGTSDGDPTSPEFYLDINGGGDENGNNGLPTASTMGAWHHMVFTYDAARGAGNVGEVWIDGVQVGTGLGWNGNGTGALDAAGTQVPFGIGLARINSTNNGDFQGMIDDFSTWSRELTAAEIGQLYNGGAGATADSLADQSGLVIYAPLDELTGNLKLVQEAGTLEPGGSIGATAVYGDYFVGNNVGTEDAVWNMELDFLNDTAADLVTTDSFTEFDADFVDVLDTLTFNSDSALQLAAVDGQDLADFDPLAGKIFIIARYGSLDGIFSNTPLDYADGDPDTYQLPDAYAAGMPSDWYIDYSYEGQNLIAIVPEPGTLALLVIAGLFGLVVLRRRQK